MTGSVTHMENQVVKVTEFCLEQMEKNTIHAFETMKQSVVSTADFLAWAQGEVQKVVDFTQQGAETFVAQLDKIKEQQLAFQKDLQKQVNSLLELFKKQA
jgi:hypothetical protein